MSLVCKLIGHKFVIDVYTGRRTPVTDIFGQKHETPMCKLQRLDFCARCGADRNPRPT